jgi:O-antigen/teichoic acid export membrane protein
MRLGKTTVVHFASQVVASVAGFVATFAIVRLLGAAELGVYSVAVALVFWANIPAAAIGDALKKRISAAGEGGQYVAAGILLNLVPLLLAVGAVLAFPSAVESYLVPEGSGLSVPFALAPLLALMLVGNVAFVTVTDVLDGYKRVALSGVTVAVERVGRTSVQLGLVVFAGLGVASLLVGHAVTMLLGAVLGLALAGIRWGRPTREHARSLYAYARYSWLGTLQTRAFSWMDTIVLGLFVTRELIGVYEVAWNLASLLALVSISVQRTLFPQLSDLAERGNEGRIHHLLDEGLVFTGVFVIPGLVGAAVIGDRVLKIYDPVFQQGVVVLLVLIVARGVAAYGKQLLSVINALNRPDIAFRINLLFIGTNLGLNLVLVWRFGWLGAAVATAVSATLILALGYRSVTSLIDRPRVPLKQISFEAVAAALMGAAVLLLRPYAPGNHYATLGLVAVGAAVYTVALLGLSARIREKVRGLV